MFAEVITGPGGILHLIGKVVGRTCQTVYHRTTDLAAVEHYDLCQTRVAVGIGVLRIIAGGCIVDRVAVLHREGVHEVLGRVDTTVTVDGRRIVILLPVPE